MSSKDSSQPTVIRILPNYYIYVLDTNKNVTSVVVGPRTFTRQDHERLVFGPSACLNIPPRHYALIANPAQRDEDGKVISDEFGQVKLHHGDEQIRFEQEPFSLYPGEKLVGRVTPITIVPTNQALRLRVERPFEDTDDNGDKVLRQAGEEYLFKGPGDYTPRVEVSVAQKVSAITVEANTALHLRARRDCTDISGVKHCTGEEWLHRAVGAYLPGVDEEVVSKCNAHILTAKKALHLRAKQTFTDSVFQKVRKAGDEWLVTSDMAERHIPDVYEEVKSEVSVTVLSNRQYAVVNDPVDPATGLVKLGTQELRKGECTFFLKPGESLANGVQDVFVLAENEALLLTARENFADRKAGDNWLITGPVDYVPPVSVSVVERRKAIPLAENEGIYVRDTNTGKVRVESGVTYMVQAHEQLWEKELSPAVEELLSRNDDPLFNRANRNATRSSSARDKTRMVTFRAPHNSAVQVYDFQSKKQRVVFGPDLVRLAPDEEFTVLSLSGGVPKKPNTIKALALLLGPDFCTDVVTVATEDHARLQLKLSYNWHFEVDENAGEKLFQVPDVIGDMCARIASRIRGAAAGVPFDTFHKNSAKIIRQAVFGTSTDGSCKDEFRFEANNLVVSNIDIQSVEPVDQKTRDSLLKSVQLAIDVAVASREATARQEANRVQQEARGRLERQQIADEAEAEKQRRELLELRAASAAIESAGSSKAEAAARAEAANIEAQMVVDVAKKKVEAMTVQAEAELSRQRAQQELEFEHQKSMDNLAVEKAKQLGAIESEKFAGIVKALGPETLKAMAEASEAQKTRMLQALGLKGYLINSNGSPLNLFSTANQFLANADQE